jgi:hypothetical protein
MISLLPLSSKAQQNTLQDKKVINNNLLNTTSNKSFEIKSPQINIIDMVDTNDYISIITRMDNNTTFYVVNYHGILKDQKFSSEKKITQHLSSIDGIKKFSHNGVGHFKLELDNTKAKEILKNIFKFSNEYINSIN